MVIQVIIKAVIVVIHTIMVLCVNNKSTDGGDKHTYGVTCSNKRSDSGDTHHSLSNSRHLLSGCQAAPIAPHMLGSW